MTVNSNLLLSDAQEPSAGLNYADAKLWAGGPLRAAFRGVFGSGCTFDLMATTRLLTAQEIGDVQVGAALFSDIWNDADWVSLGHITAPGDVTIDTVNPCLIAVMVTDPATDTRVKVVLG